MKTGLIFMTALVPTKGHQYLIDFAATFADKVYVIISTRNYEPTSYTDRYHGLLGDRFHNNVFFYHHDDTLAPQKIRLKLLVFKIP